MKKFIALFIFSVSLFVTAAEAQCPEISLIGPAALISQGEKLKFTLTVSPVEKELPLKYVWRITGGKIVTGQGTTSIEVTREELSLTVTVEVLGLPHGCPHTFSERGWFEPPPAAIKVGVWKYGSDLSPLQRFVIGMAAAAGDQGYIFIVKGPAATPESLNRLRQTVIDHSPKDGALYSPRITLVDAEGPEELVELWRVPPGASNPECETCHKQQCPELITSGPAGPPVPHKPIKFSLSLKGQTPTDLRFEWSTNTGQILDGQGTKSIQVMPPWEKDWNLHATVEVSGLPSGCPSTAVESIMRPDLPHPVLIDEFDVTPAFQDPSRLRIAIEELENNHSDRLFVVLYHPKSESTLKVREVLKKLTGFFKSNSDLQSDRYSVVSSPSDRYFLRIYRIPPGAHEPTP